MNLNDKTALVTGASRGMGRGSAAVEGGETLALTYSANKPGLNALKT